MRKVLLAAFAVALGCLPAIAQQSVLVRPTPYAAPGKPAYCQITVLSSATKLITANCSTGSILPNAKIAQICVSTAAVRYTSDPAVTPTASVGIPVAPQSATLPTCFPYSGPITTIQFIQQAGGAVLDVETFP
jgi:hypothetical protein